MDCCLPFFSKKSSVDISTKLLQQKNNIQTSRFYTFKFGANYFSGLFKNNIIIVDSQNSPNPGKQFVSELILKHIQISNDHISAFAKQHASALKKPEAEEKIEHLVNNWRTNPDFRHLQAECAIKEILGDKIKDEDVLFMLRKFCITHIQNSNFESNYKDLVNSQE